MDVVSHSLIFQSVPFHMQGCRVRFSQYKYITAACSRRLLEYNVIIAKHAKKHWSENMRASARIQSSKLSPYPELQLHNRLRKRDGTIRLNFKTPLIGCVLPEKALALSQLSWNVRQDQVRQEMSMGLCHLKHIGTRVS